MPHEARPADAARPWFAGPALGPSHRVATVATLACGAARAPRAQAMARMDAGLRAALAGPAPARWRR